MCVCGGGGGEGERGDETERNLVSEYSLARI